MTDAPPTVRPNKVWPHRREWARAASCRANGRTAQAGKAPLDHFGMIIQFLRARGVLDRVRREPRCQRGQGGGDTPPHFDSDQEAPSLMAMSVGLATSVLAGQSSPRKAQAVIDHHLHRLFPASRQALRRNMARRPPGVFQPEGAAVTTDGRRLRPCRPFPHQSRDEMPGRTNRFSSPYQREADDLRALVCGSPITPARGIGDTWLLEV